MSDLITQPHFGTPGEVPRQAYTPGDDFYEILMEAHRDLGDAESRLVNARLILLLANHIGDLGVLRQALRAARAGVGPAAAGPVPA
ncbi:Small subunit of monooxygenase [Rubrivivax sp. A210]|uniref:DUF2783 domain-containing protein n=1 Tax=Rubrivivax sp. A210 TaxID=2772301 RepID=UPI001917C4F0|nr:DUF2783 domain-containing protein [Rubrivivax sp. A210]CAD5375185.1 Small subunit of monooxygenase [Rubrivivax sp. A210]